MIDACQDKEADSDSNSSSDEHEEGQEFFSNQEFLTGTKSATGHSQQALKEGRAYIEGGSRYQQRQRNETYKDLIDALLIDTTGPDAANSSSQEASFEDKKSQIESELRQA